MVFSDWTSTLDRSNKTLDFSNVDAELIQADSKTFNKPDTEFLVISLLSIYPIPVRSMLLIWCTKQESRLLMIGFNYNYAQGRSDQIPAPALTSTVPQKPENSVTIYT